MNRYGVDSDYFNKRLNSIIRDMESYKPTELLRELSRLKDAVRPIGQCVQCKKQTLTIFDDDNAECNHCGNVQAFESK